jgi:hypothetical protein
VENPANFWTDEETVARVLEALAAAPRVLILAAPMNYDDLVHTRFTT